MLSRLKLYEGEEHPHQAQVSASRAQEAPVEPAAPARTARVAQPEPAPEPQAELQPDEAEIPEEPAAEEEAAEAGQAETADDEDLEALTVPRLRELAAERGITVPSRARKADIIEALRS